MTAFIEGILLFFVLFFRMPQGMPEGPIGFFANAELAKIILYTIPAIALIWYLLLKSKSLKELGISLPKKNDIFALLISFPALLLISFTIFYASSYLDKSIAEVPSLLAPQTLLSWFLLGFSCLFSAFLEESYFRFYLLSKNEDMKINPHVAVLISTFLFAYCHIYEGPWGFLNAALCGIVLCYVFLRFRSLYGITIAHAGYNFLVYVLTAT